MGDKIKDDKIKTSIVINRRLWEEFKTRVVAEKGAKSLSRAIEEAIKEEVGDALVIKALEGMLRDLGLKPLGAITPVKPRVATDAGKTVGELRDSRAQL